MTTIENNQAAWLTAATTRPLKVGPGPDQTKPEEDEVVIQVAAVAINPSDWKFQNVAYLPIAYPHVQGSDAAGTVVRVGSGVTRFKTGDRVIGHCGGLSYGGARHGAFQNFTTLREAVAATIPDSLTFEQAVVLPLGLSTSSCGLHEVLKLRLPISPTANAGETSLGYGSSKPTEKEVVLIWGGSSSMGTVAIQLAAAAGYSVITTASERNHDYVRSLATDKADSGSIVVFDHSGPPDDVARKIIDHIKSSGEMFAGAYDCISADETARACEEVVHALGGGVLALVLPIAEARYEDVKSELVWATKPGYVPGHPGVELWSKFVYKALERGVLRGKPDPLVVGHGLGKIQEAMDILKKGVSAKKIVVTL